MERVIRDLIMDEVVIEVIDECGVSAVCGDR
jgi:hypothetical protein